MELPPRNILADTGPLFALIHAGDADHARAVELVAIGERLGVLDVIALDRRDFSRYRTRTRRAFTNHFPERT